MKLILAKSRYFIWENIYISNFLGVLTLNVSFLKLNKFFYFCDKFKFFNITIIDSSVVLRWALKNRLRIWLSSEFWISFCSSDRYFFREYTCQFLVLTSFLLVHTFFIFSIKPLKSRNQNSNSIFWRICDYY